MPEINYFLKIDGLKGETLVPGFENQTVVISHSFGQWAKAVGPGNGTGSLRPDITQIDLVLALDRIWNRLYTAHATGEKFRNAVLSIRHSRGGPNRLSTYVFNDVIVSSFLPSDSRGGEATAVLAIQLDFASYKYSTV